MIVPATRIPACRHVAIASALMFAVGFAVAGEAAPVTLHAALTGEVLHANTLDVLGLSFQDVVAVPRLVGNLLDFTDCRATAYGGSFTGEVNMNLATSSQHFHFEVKDLDLAIFLRRFANVDDGTSGKVDGWLDLTIPAGNTTEITGSGHFEVREGNFIQFGVLANLLAGDFNNTHDQDRLVAFIEIGNGKVRFKDTTILSPSAFVKIRGYIGFDGGLRLVLIPYAEFKVLQVVPGAGNLAAWLLGNVTSRVARAAIRGSLSHPVVTINPFAE